MAEVPSDTPRKIVAIDLGGAVLSEDEFDALINAPGERVWPLTD